MKFKTILLGTATLALIAGPAIAQDAPKTDATKKHHHHVEHAAGASSIDARIDELEQEVHDLRAQEAAAQAAPAPSDAVSQVQFEALQNQVYEQQASTTSMTKSSWWANTKITGRFFWDVSNIDATGTIKSATGTAFKTKSQQDGFNYDLKRAYLIIDHKFNDTYAANLTTDATYDSVTGASQIFIKKAYLQAKYADAFTVRVGAADLPWVPFVESLYGYRYVENVLIDRTKFGTSTDWGAHILGTFDLGGPTVGYQFSAVNGFGYKADPIGNSANRSKGVDFEGRVNLSWDGFVAAIGGYDGKRGKDVQDTVYTVPTYPSNPPSPTPGQTHCSTGYASNCHTATRFDALLAYTDDTFRVGGEYFAATDWNSVTSTSAHPHDSSDGYSAFASWKFDPMWSVFGRYDWVKPTGALIYKGASQARNEYYNFGLSYSPIPALDFALVYKHDANTNGFLADSDFSSLTCVAYGTGGAINTSKGTCNQGTYNEIGLFGQVNF